MTLCVTYAAGVHADCLDRLSQCCRILLDPNVKAKMSDTFLKSCQEAYSSLVAKQKAIKTKVMVASLSLCHTHARTHTLNLSHSPFLSLFQATELDRKGRASQADDLIQFRQLRAQVRHIKHIQLNA